ncbi:MAG: hypothetical protein SCARUB_04888, partial [Candidatus Scalindua rubra]
RVRRYYRTERTKEWLRSLIAQLGEGEDPHRILKARTVTREDIYV